MEHAILVVSIIVQIGLGAYILFRDPKSWMNRLFAACMVAYSLSSFVGLYRLVATNERTASFLVMLTSIIIFVWNGTLIALAIIAIFYREQFNKHTTWILGGPIGIAILLTIVELSVYLNLPDKTAIVRAIPGIGIYYSNAQAFPVWQWGVGYAMLWAGISLVLLANIIIRRPGVERNSAAILGASILISAVLGFVGSRILSGSLGISIPSLAATLLAVAFGYTIVRHRLFSTEEVALELMLDNLHDGVVVLQSDQAVLNCNQSAIDLLGLAGRSVHNWHIDRVLENSALPRAVWRNLWSRLEKDQKATSETQYTLDGTERVVVNEVTVVRDPLGQVQGYVWMVHDVTELRRTRQEIDARNAELQNALDELQVTIESQDQLLKAIQALSAPTVPVIQGIVVMPLSGQIDSDRAKGIIDSLLVGISDHEAQVAIIDITGVPVVDTFVAQYLIQAARAASLMGCRPILVGIRPEIAQVLVQLGIDMGEVPTFSDLQSGVEYALRVLGVKLVHAPTRRSAAVR